MSASRIGELLPPAAPSLLCIAGVAGAHARPGAGGGGTPREACSCSIAGPRARGTAGCRTCQCGSRQLRCSGSRHLVHPTTMGSVPKLRRHCAHVLDCVCSGGCTCGGRHSHPVPPSAARCPPAPSSVVVGPRPLGPGTPGCGFRPKWHGSEGRRSASPWQSGQRRPCTQGGVAESSESTAGEPRGRPARSPLQLAVW